MDHGFEIDGRCSGGVLENILLRLFRIAGIAD